MPTVGYATLQIIPSIQGISAEMRRQLVAPAEQAGQQAGEGGGGRFREAFTGALAALSVDKIAEKAGEVFSEAWGEALEQGQIVNKLKASLGASNAQAAAYGKLAGKLYSSGVSDSFEDAAEAIKNVAQGGLVPPGATNKQLQSIATKASDVANTFGLDFESVTNASSRLIATGLVKSTGDAFDLITKGYQQLGPKADDLLDTFNEYSVQFQKMGLSGQTALGLIDQGIKAGARDTDLVADAIKEFSIRAVDGSATTIAGFKGLGLSAKGMATQIGKGGKDASAGLQTVLDKLRKVPDPVKRSQLAVDLFGTQAEDLGKSLYSLDPSKAVDAIGKVGGSATQLGKDLRSGPSYEITVFKRTLQQGFVNFLGSKVIPTVSKFGSAFDKYALPPLQKAGGVLNDNFIPAVKGTISVSKTVVGWFQKYGLWLTPLAVIVGGLTLALTANAIGASAAAGATSLYMTATGIATAVTGGFSAAMGLLNSVMALNPFVLITIAVVALGVALVVAYKKSDTFRAIVTAAWRGIQTAAMAVWTTTLKPIISALVTGWQAIAAGAMWLFRSVLLPAFNVIKPVALVLATIIGVTLLLAFKVWWFGTKLYIDAIVLAFKALAVVGMWLWKSVFSPVVGWIVGGFREMGAAAKWLYSSVIKPVFGLILLQVRLWWAGFKLYVNANVALVRLLGNTALWLWRNAVSPAFHGIGDLASWLYAKALKPPLDRGKALAASFGGAFKSAAGVIGTEFHKIEGLAKTPIAFVINTVYNKGLVGVWNKVAGAFGAPKLAAFKGFATGGGVFGAGTATSDSVPAWLSTGEHVWTAREVQGAGGHGAVEQMRAWAAAGGGKQSPGFKSGGPFGWIGSAANAVAGAGSAAWSKAKHAAGWIKDTLAASARAGVRAVVDPLINRIPGSGLIGPLARAVPKKMIDTLFGYADQADAKGASNAFGGGAIPSGKHAAVIRAALSAAGVPPPGTMNQWLSGMNTLIGRESGWNASAVNRTDSNAKAGHPSQGLAQTIPSTWAHYVPSSLKGRGILDPVGNVAAAVRYIVARYGNITGVQQANASKPPKGYDKGGVLPPGPTMAINKTGRPEAILTASQWSTAAAAIARTTTAAQAPAGGGLAERDVAAALAGMTVVVQVGNETIASVARTEVRRANGELVAVLNAGGGQ